MNLQNKSLRTESHPKPQRIMMYSHDSWGLGHLRRSLAIAASLVKRQPATDILLVTGSPCATQFELPNHCDVLKLPAVSKDAGGAYVTRSLSSALSNTIEMRRQLITQAYRSFAPHVVVVDHQIIGLHGEALDMLQLAHQDRCLLIYGLRDILDTPEVVERAWAGEEQRWAMRSAYNRIMVYGDPRVFDPRKQYPSLRHLHHKINFTGYIANSPVLNDHSPVPSLRKKVLVTVGGGEDGYERIESYIDALALSPVDWRTEIVTGPLMPEDRVNTLSKRVFSLGLSEDVMISRFIPDMQQKLQSSDAVVSMAGYNSCAEIMLSKVPAILMPRQEPRQEQLIRALRLEQLGLARCLCHLDPHSLRRLVIAALQSGPVRATAPAMDGLAQFGRALEKAREEHDRRSVSTSSPVQVVANQ